MGGSMGAGWWSARLTCLMMGRAALRPPLKPYGCRWGALTVQTSNIDPKSNCTMQLHSPGHADWRRAAGPEGH